MKKITFHILVLATLNVGSAFAEDQEFLHRYAVAGTPEANFINVKVTPASGAATVSGADPEFLHRHVVADHPEANSTNVDIRR